VIRILENLEVADQVPDDKPDQDHTGDRHEDFPSDGGGEEAANEIH
jgi:hypothetical protein